MSETETGVVGTATTIDGPAKKARKPRKPAGTAKGKAIKATQSNGKATKDNTKAFSTLTDPTAIHLTASQHKQAVQFLSLAADESRLKILILLIGGERNVTAICQAIGMEQPAVSHHLALLRVSGLIESRRDGKFNFYSVLPDGRILVAAAVALVS